MITTPRVSDVLSSISVLFVLKAIFSIEPLVLGIFNQDIHFFSNSVYTSLFSTLIRPHPDYGDVIYDQPNLSSLPDTNKIESVQYNAALASTGVIRGTS